MRYISMRIYSIRVVRERHHSLDRMLMRKTTYEMAAQLFFFFYKRILVVKFDVFTLRIFSRQPHKIYSLVNQAQCILRRLTTLLTFYQILLL